MDISLTYRLNVVQFVRVEIDLLVDCSSIETQHKSQIVQAESSMGVEKN